MPIQQVREIARKLVVQVMVDMIQFMNVHVCISESLKRAEYQVECMLTRRFLTAVLLFLGHLELHYNEPVPQDHELKQALNFVF